MPASRASNPPAGGTLRHVAVLAFAALAVAANFTNYGAVIPSLRAELHASAAQVGLLSTLLYVGIGVTYLLGGLLVDRFGPRRVLCLALLVVAAGGGLLPAVPQLAWVVACRLVVGLGAGVAILAGSQAARLTGRAALGQGVFGGAMQAGAAVGLFATPTLVQVAGWRGAFLDWALLALAASGACGLLMRPDPPTGRARRHRRLAAAVRSGPLWTLGVVHLATLGIGQAVAPWLAVYLAATYSQLPLARAARLGAAGLLLGTLVRPLGGALISHWHVRHQSLQRAGTLLAVVGMVALALPGQMPWLTAAGLVLLTVGTTLPYAGVFDQAGRIGEAAALGPGAAQGVVSTISAPASAFGPPLIGLLAERTGSYTTPFAVLTLLGLGGCASAVLAGGRLRRALVAGEVTAGNQGRWLPDSRIGPLRRRFQGAALRVAGGQRSPATASAVEVTRLAERPAAPRPWWFPARMAEAQGRSWAVSIAGASLLVVLLGLGGQEGCGAGCTGLAGVARARVGSTGRPGMADATLSVAGTGGSSGMAAGADGGRRDPGTPTTHGSGIGSRTSPAGTPATVPATGGSGPDGPPTTVPLDSSGSPPPTTTVPATTTEPSAPPTTAPTTTAEPSSTAPTTTAPPPPPTTPPTTTVSSSTAPPTSDTTPPSSSATQGATR